MKYSDRVNNVTMNLCYEGGGAGFAVWPLPLSSFLAEYARVTTCRTPGVIDQDLRQLEAWLGNHRRLMDVMVGLLLPVCQCRPVVMVVAGGSILLDHGVAPGGAQYASCLKGWMNLAPIFGWGCGL
jgi:hypothetical protein